MLGPTDHGPVLHRPDLNSADQSSQPEREWARQQLHRKRKLAADIVAYVTINTFLIVVWAMSGFGYFWPGWVLAGWGVLLLLDVWNLRFHRPITEADIDAELRRRRG
jgi:2TM domain